MSDPKHSRRQFTSSSSTTVRLHSAIGCITPADFLASRGNEIWAARDRKLEAAREVRARRHAELQEAA